MVRRAGSGLLPTLHPFLRENQLLSVLIILLVLVILVVLLVLIILLILLVLLVFVVLHGAHLLPGH